MEEELDGFNAMKPTQAKPSLYAHFFIHLKEIAIKYGYNLVLHGSLSRDLDLIAIPWVKDVGDVKEMIKEFSKTLGGKVMYMTEEQRTRFPHGREVYVIDLNRGGYDKDYNYYPDPEYYLDISVMPTKHSTLNT